MTEREAFETWVDRTWPQGLSTDEWIVSWDAWQEAVRRERERWEAAMGVRLDEPSQSAFELWEDGVAKRLSQRTREGQG